MALTILSVIADILAIVDFFLSVIIIAYLRGSQRQRANFTKERLALYEDFSALRQNILDDGLISDTIQYKLRTALYRCQTEYWLVLGPRGIIHIRQCLYLLSKDKFFEYKSEICNHIDFMVAKLKGVDYE